MKNGLPRDVRDAPHGIAETLKRLKKMRENVEDKVVIPTGKTEDEQDATDEVEFTITRADGNVEQRKKRSIEELAQEVLRHASKGSGNNVQG